MARELSPFIRELAVELIRQMSPVNTAQAGLLEAQTGSQPFRDQLLQAQAAGLTAETERSQQMTPLEMQERQQRMELVSRLSPLQEQQLAAQIAGQQATTEGQRAAESRAQRLFPLEEQNLTGQIEQARAHTQSAPARLLNLQAETLAALNPIFNPPFGIGQPPNADLVRAILPNLNSELFQTPSTDPAAQERMNLILQALSNLKQ